MKVKIILSILLVLLFFIGLIIIGVIGANISFEEITLQVLYIKPLFLGIIKIAPLVLVIGFVMIITKELQRPNE